MSSEDFKSFVVTDPDILDEGIDISGLRKTTDTSPLLLGDLQPGLRYDPTLQSSYSDLLQYFSGGLPMLPEPPAAVPPATGGGGTGSGGQATTPITTPVTTPTTGGGITNVDTPLTQMVTDPVTGQTQTVRQAMTSDAAYRGTTSDPFLTSGAAGGARLPTTPTSTGITVEDLTQPSNVGDFQITGAPALTNQSGVIKDAVDPQPVRTILGPDGITYDAVTGQPIVDDPTTRLPQLGSVTEEDLVDNRNLLQKLGLPANFDLKQAALEAGINLAIGVPVSLIARALGTVVPERDPRQTKLEELYDVKDGTIQSGLMAGYNPVSGNPLNPTFGLQDAYQDRIDTIENTLKDKYNLSATDIAGIKAGTFNTEKLDAQTDLVQRLVDLEDAKKKEADVLGITAAEDKRQGEAEMRQTIADAIRERDLGAGPRVTTQPVTGIEGPPSQISGAPVTGVTRPGTVLGKPGIEKFDDAEAALSNTGTSIDALNPNNRQLHFDNTEKLREAARNGEITDAEYKRLSAFDATKTMGLDPVTGTLSSIAYQTVQAAAGDQTVGNAITDIANNIQGVAGNITPEEQVKYQEIITGEKIYRDPILGMVEPPAPMTLADDTINRMVDDVDLDLFDTTPVDTTPIDTTVTGTLGPPSEISGPQVTEEKPVDIELADNRAVRELDSDQIIEYENLTNQLEGQEMQRTGNPDIGLFKQEEIKNKAIDQIQDQDIIDRGGGDDIGTGGLDPDRGQQIDRGSSGAGDNRPVSTTTGPPSTGFQPQSTYDAELEDERDVGGGGNDGGGNGGGGKIVCTMMNESYGFGSFRNKIWMKFHKDLSPEYQKGYHKLFLPLVKIAKKNIIVKKALEHIAVHSTIDMRQSMRGKTHLLGRVYRKILLPLCYWVGKNG